MTVVFDLFHLKWIGFDRYLWAVEVDSAKGKSDGGNTSELQTDHGSVEASEDFASPHRNSIGIGLVTYSASFG
jgi:hypothetical protein